MLHQTAYRDSSQLIELMTLDYGRVAAVARGARGNRSRLRGLLRPFTPLLISFSGRGELVTLTGAEPRGPALTLRGEYLFAGFYVNELLVRLTHRDDPAPEVFDSYEWVLTGLRDGEPLQPLLRQFECRLLDLLGYGLMLETDIAGNSLLPAGFYDYRLEEGPVVVDDARHAALPVHGSTLLGLAKGELEGLSASMEARRLLRAAIDAQLGGRPLHTRKVLRAMKRGG